jgi:DNA helicase HerA-like ATPase
MTPSRSSDASLQPKPNGASSDVQEPEAPLAIVQPDADGATSTAVRVRLTPDRWSDVRRDAYVELHDPDDDLEFLGQLVAGPFYTAQAPEGEGDTSSVLPYDLHAMVEVLGQLLPGDRLVRTATRPRPSSEVYVMPPRRLRRLLTVEGDVRLGRLTSHAGLEVRADSDDKAFLPRNVGIFGTVGSGKSNTAQVLMEEAAAAGWAVVVIDVEGEYVRMDEPTDEADLTGVLYQTYGLAPRGVPDVRVYVPSSGASTATAPRPFKIPIAALPSGIVADVLGLSDAEQRVFGMMTEQAAAQRTPTATSPGGPLRPYDLQYLIDGLAEGPAVEGEPTIRLLPFAPRADVLTAGVLRSKLVHLGRSGLLDLRALRDVPELPIDDLLVPGRLSVLDVSETDDRSRNLAITYVLQQLFDRILQTPRGAPMASGTPRPPLLVVIEEVHTFVSRASIAKMKTVLDMLQIITRRGRKRWMGLALVSQQPNHVPNEIFELANTRFIHQLKSQPNIAPVRETTGGVDDAAWAAVPALGPGQCLVASPVFAYPMLLDVRPARSRRMLVT